MRNDQRVLNLQGATNFRDLGGYVGREGRPLRWRRVFRSDHLGHLTEADRSILAPLGLRRAFDFRGRDERLAQTYELPGLRQFSLAIEPTVVRQMSLLSNAGIALAPRRMAALMEDLYRHLVNDEAQRFAEWFAHLLDDNSPLVFHCTAGKDRTGLAAALLLLALGVPLCVVQQDYLLTNEVYRRPASASAEAGIPVDALAVLWSASSGFLRAAMGAIDVDHGGIDRYLEQRMGLTSRARERLAALYLQPA
ncbi:MAG TPA: tyrosine-protein phosphatase [Burkholderiaceae bacterium]|nr:tyrosine-protein phosphatase [Burkholderiaceae bacterium]